WRSRPLGDLLAEHGLAGAEESPFEHNGWSGARLTTVARDGRGFVLKRTSWELDWIARATRDTEIREAWLAAARLKLPGPVVAPHLGAASDDGIAAILMPDLGDSLVEWDEPGLPPIDATLLDNVVTGVAALHSGDWTTGDGAALADVPWCPLLERVTLLTPPTAERYRASGLVIGDRFLAGWEAFRRHAPGAASDLVERLSADPAPLLAALRGLPAVPLHGDLKLANVAPLPDGRLAIIDWQMALDSAVAVELGWFLVSNVAALPAEPDDVLARYRAAVVGCAGERTDDVLGDWERQLDLTFLVGLLLRGWRKGLDADAGIATGAGVSARVDLLDWSRRAVDAAQRSL
ncbi:MAG: phosphotransferase family protein, partial [Chloroflexota bacterium]